MIYAMNEVSKMTAERIENAKNRTSIILCRNKYRSYKIEK